MVPQQRGLFQRYAVIRAKCAKAAYALYLYIKPEMNLVWRYSTRNQSSDLKSLQEN